MKKQWQVCRRFIESSDGQRRWDYAYQSVLRWAMEETMKQPPTKLPSQENNHENCTLCQSIHQPPNAKSKH